MQFLGRVVLTAGALVCLTAGIAHAQTTSSATETKKFQVIAVDGSDLVVKLPEGTRELTVPDDFKFTVDGKQLSVHELKPGMAGTATITTRTTVTPVTVTEVKNGSGQAGDRVEHHRRRRRRDSNPSRRAIWTNAA